MSTGTDIAQREAAALSTNALSPEQIDLVKRTIAVGATDDELALFIHQCNRTGLDPFAKQIYSIERKTKVDDKWVKTRQTQIAIDGARLIAERVNQRRPGAYRPGEVQWLERPGVWVDAWVADTAPLAARVTVYKDGAPVTSTANYKEFVQTTSGGSPTRQWKAMPAHMLAKCAEMLALRRAFPQELSGLVIEEEPALAGPKESTVIVGEEMATDAQRAEIDALLDKLVADEVTDRPSLDARLSERYGTSVVSELTQAQALELLERLRAQS